MLVEKFGIFDFGVRLPVAVQDVLIAYDNYQSAKMMSTDKAKLWVQGIISVLLIICLSLHIASVGLIGLMVIILATTFCGVTDEDVPLATALLKKPCHLLPLLVVFFSIVLAVIIDQHLFTPVIDWVLTFDGQLQFAVLFLANYALYRWSVTMCLSGLFISMK